MNTEAREARVRIVRAENELRNAKSNLASIERTCDHQWDETQYTPDVREGHMAENWLGPIRNGRPALSPVHVPRKETKKWTRTCSECGKSDTTTKTTEKVSHTPQF